MWQYCDRMFPCNLNSTFHLTQSVLSILLHTVCPSFRVRFLHALPRLLREWQILNTDIASRYGLRTSMALPFELGAAGVVVWVDVEETARTTELEGLVRFNT